MPDDPEPPPLIRIPVPPHGDDDDNDLGGEAPCWAHLLDDEGRLDDVPEPGDSR